jgi:hypothetical protein
MKGRVKRRLAPTRLVKVSRSSRWCLGSWSDPNVTLWGYHRYTFVQLMCG